MKLSLLKKYVPHLKFCIFHRIYRNYRRADFTCICQYVFQNHVKSRKIYVWAMPGASPGFERGGGPRIFFSDLGIACREARGFGAMLPENFF